MSLRTETSLGASTLTLETGKIAKQAHGAVVVQQGGTVVLVTAVIGPATKFGSLDYVPLMVDYREKTYAAGKIPGGFFKREGRPTEKEILSARLIDRPIRPLLPYGLLQEVQLMASVLSSDGAYDPDILALLGGGVAVRLSGLPLRAPLSAVRIGKVHGQFVCNPTYAELKESPLDVVIAGTPEGIVMLEAGLREVSEEEFQQAVDAGYQHIRTLIDWQEAFARQAARPPLAYQVIQLDPALLTKVGELALGALERLTDLPTKDQREVARAALVAQLNEQLTAQNGTWTAEAIDNAFYEVELRLVRRMVLEQQRRPDGRQFTQLRPITCEVGVLPRTHGSGLFTRGQTQSLTVTTLGTSDDEQLVESLEGETYKTFMLHYNFPPFSVGEIKPVRGPGRREIGHGALAERALQPMMPTPEAFPYTVRLVSDILESNGSSSMATVCAGTLALLDAGVPLKASVGGIAMGMVSDTTRHVILTDIAGLEDHFGDMDFKIAGTRQGMTAVQLDVKRPQGLTLVMIRETLTQAHEARFRILDQMAQALAQPRPSLSVYAPRITTIRIHPDKIRDVIGPGGKMIRKIIELTKAEIDVEDDGSISVASVDGAAAERAIQMIRDLTAEVEVGKVYKGKVKRIMNFGAFCEILPGKEGLVHVSELDYKYVDKVEDVVKLGDEFEVKVIEIDEQGRVNLSRKALLPPPPEGEHQPRPERPRRDRPDDRHHRREQSPRHQSEVPR